MGSPPVISTSLTGEKRSTSAMTWSSDMRCPPVKLYSVSHQEQRRLHPVSLTKMQGRPAKDDSPWIERKISVICIKLSRRVGASLSEMGKGTRPGPALFLKVSGGGAVSLPYPHVFHANASTRACLAFLPRLAKKIFRQILGRGILLPEWLQIIQILVIEALDDLLQCGLQIFEIPKQADR